MKKLQRFIVQDNIHAMLATLRNKFAIFLLFAFFLTKPQTKMQKNIRK